LQSLLEQVGKSLVKKEKGSRGVHRAHDEMRGGAAQRFKNE